MADTKQQDLSMEEILSSIRNILLDESGTPIQPVADPDPIDDIADLSEADSVFDLSKEMLVEDKPVFEYAKIVDSAQTQDIKTTDDIDSLLGDDNLSIDDIATESALNAHEQAIITEPEEQNLTDNLVDDLEIALVEADSNTIEDNLQEEIINIETDELSQSLQQEIEEELLSEPDSIIMEDFKIPNDESQMPSFAEPHSPLLEEDSKSDSSAEFSNPVMDTEVTEFEELDTSSDPIFDEALDVEVAQRESISIDDASENILSRFASVFEQDQQRKLIEDVAREEISEQTQRWLDKNLQSIVTDLVKKELARVMVKAYK